MAVFSMTRSFLLGAALMTATAWADSRPLFTPAPVATFDGRAWTGLVVGQSTWADVRPQWKTGRGTYERSTQLMLAKDAGLRVDCLWDGPKKGEVLSAIVLRYSGATPTGNQLARAFDADQKHTEILYPRGRYEDWRVVRFPLRGVTAFQIRVDGAGDYTTPLLVFTSPDATARLSKPLDDHETPVAERVDPVADEPKVGEFGSAQIDFDDRIGDEVPDWARQNLRDDLRDARAGGALVWRRGATGFYKLSATSSRNKSRDRGSVSVSSVIEAAGPYGTIHTEGSDTETWKTGDYNGPADLPAALRRAIREARRDAERKFETAMKASGPPPVSSIRQGQWSDLVALLRAPTVAAPMGNAPVVGF